MSNQFNTEAVKRALESNRKLQEAIRKDIAVIQEKKRRNRLQAATCIRELGAENVTVHPPSSRPTQRKAKRHFFVDLKRKPEPNEDAKLRQADDFFFHTRPPWHQKEVKRLQQAVQEAESAATATENDAFYQHVQRSFVEGSPNKGATVRTVEECRVQHQRTLEVPLSDSELEQMSTILASNTGTVDWSVVASTLSENRSQPCTPFQCLAAHHRQKTAPASPWTPEEDIILFKFLAAAGPQMILDFRNPLMQTLQRLLPNKSKSKIVFHATQSLLNPNLQHGDWTNTEERALAIYMKIYNKDVALVSSSHLHRNQKSVADKWDRSLNPKYSTKPFTADEDARLMELSLIHI